MPIPKWKSDITELAKAYSDADYFYSEENGTKENVDKALNALLDRVTHLLKEVVEEAASKEWVWGKYADRVQELLTSLGIEGEENNGN